MAKMINITDRMSKEQLILVYGDKQYVVNDGMGAVLKFEELVTKGTSESFVEAIKVSLGDKAAKELNIMSLTIENFKVLSIAILALMQGITYEEADARFQEAGK